jgi:hypothetical protein
VTALVAILTLTLAAETTAPSRRLGPDAPNAVRARAGLLPRKVPRAGLRPRLRTVSAPAPAFLAEPLALAEARPAAAALPAGAPSTAGPGVPEEIGTLRLAVRGVSTEVTLRLRFDP